MIYFSEIKNKTVQTEDGVYVGKLQDFIFLAAEQPNVTKLVISTVQKDIVTVPISYLQKINGNLIIHKQYQTAELAENELYIEKNLLDKQIIDIKGNKVVRVNDIALQNKPLIYIAGVDIGILGILRWFKLDEVVSNSLSKIGMKIPARFLSWADIQPLELARGRVKLKTEEEKLERIRAEDLADYLEETNVRNITKILSIMDEEFAAEVIGNLNINYQHALIRSFTNSKAAKVINLIDPDEAVDILLTLSPRKREQILTELTEEKRKEIEYLLNFSKTPIGDYITSEYLAVKPDTSVREIIAQIKKETSDFSFFYYIYVVSDQNQLIGVINLHELLMQTPDSPAYKFMVQDVVVIHLTTPEEIAIKKMLKYKLQSLPVIDENKRMLGVITIDDLTELLVEKL